MGETGGEKVYMDVKVVGYKGVKREMEIRDGKRH
jgi:hypothetical protein